MTRLEYILIFFIGIILILYLFIIGFFTYKIWSEVKNKNILPEKKVNSDNNKVEFEIDINSPYQTDFFNKSAEYSEKVLFGKIKIQEYGEPQYYANNLIDIISKLNEETKKSVVIAIKYMCIEPMTCRNNEKIYREIAEKERVPIWFIILREAVKKVVPEFMQTSELNITTTIQEESKIIPLYQRTG